MILPYSNQNIHSMVIIKPTRNHWATTACLNIEGLKSYLKDSPVCLDLAYFQPKNKTEKLLFRYLWLISPFFKMMQKIL